MVVFHLFHFFWVMMKHSKKRKRNYIDWLLPPSKFPCFTALNQSSEKSLCQENPPLSISSYDHSSMGSKLPTQVMDCPNSPFDIDRIIDDSSSPLVLHSSFSTPPGYPQFPGAHLPRTVEDFGLSFEDSSILNSYSSCNWDVDYFAIDLPTSALYFNGYYPIGPKIDCISHVKMKYIQDPVVKKMKFANVISMSPILVFEDISADFPLRERFFKVLNEESALKLSKNCSNKSGALFYQSHHLHTYILMTTLQEIGVKSLRYSMYGTKFPLKTLAQNKLLVSLFLQSEPSQSYFDIAFSQPSDEIVVVNFSSLPNHLPKLKTYPYFGYLFNGESGGFSFDANVDGLRVSFKWYSLVFHHLIANSNVQWNISETKQGLKRKLKSLQSLYLKLKQSTSSFGGHRVEIRYSQRSFWSALSHFRNQKPYESNSLRQWLDNLSEEAGLIHIPSKILTLESISKSCYLKYLGALLDIAFHIPSFDSLYGGGLYFGDTSKSLDEIERKMAETLFNSFGFSSERQRRFDCSSDIEDWIGRTDYGQIENWQKIIQAAQKISATSSLEEQVFEEDLIEVDEEVILDILKNAKISHPKNSKKFKTHRKGTLGTTPAFCEKQDLAVYIYKTTISFHNDEAVNWRKYFSAKSK